MEAAWATAASIVLTVILALIGAWKVLNWFWLRPKRLEMLLREQGLEGNPYRFLVGDVREMMKAGKEARSKPMSLSDDIVPHVFTFVHQTIDKHGMAMLPTLLICNYTLFAYNMYLLWYLGIKKRKKKLGV